MKSAGIQVGASVTLWIVYLNIKQDFVQSSKGKKMKNTQSADEIHATLLTKTKKMLTWVYQYDPYDIPFRLEVPITEANKHFVLGDVTTFRLQILV